MSPRRPHGSNFHGEYTISISGLSGELKVKEAVPEGKVAEVSAPASFAVSDLSVTPSEVISGEKVTISALVTNTGGSEGSYTVVLKIDGLEEARQDVTLGAGKSKTITFITSKDKEGTYTIDIDGNFGQFTALIPTPPIEVPVEALPVEPPINWGLIGGIIAAVVVIGGLSYYFFIWRRRGAPRPS